MKILECRVCSQKFAGTVEMTCSKTCEARTRSKRAVMPVRIDRVQETRTAPTSNRAPKRRAKRRAKRVHPVTEALAATRREVLRMLAEGRRRAGT